MPIDIQWVRDNPEAVREWQRLRGLHCDSDCCIVQEVLDADETSRTQLVELQHCQRRLAGVKRQLRPRTSDGTETTSPKKDENEKTATATAPEECTLLLREEKQQLERQIQSLDAQWRASLRDTERRLWKLASPVDTKEATATTVPSSSSSSFDDQGSPLPPPLVLPQHRTTTTTTTKSDASIGLSTIVGMDLRNAFSQYTLHFFSQYYSSVELRGGSLHVERRHCAVNAAAVDTDNNRRHRRVRAKDVTIDPDVAHAVWGCRCWKAQQAAATAAQTTDGTSAAAASEDDDDATACSICRAEQSGALGNTPTVLLPSWIRLLTEWMPPKSIWGDKQLPVYSAVWTSNNGLNLDEADANNNNMGEVAAPHHLSAAAASSCCSLDLVTLAASSLVDARQIQNDMVAKISEFYQTLRVANGCDDRQILQHVVTTRKVSPLKLELHEMSRIELFVDIVVNNDHKGECHLGSVSCWGDAASRACGMTFAGGGLKIPKGKKQRSKEFVYIVQASVVNSSTWQTLIDLNSVADESEGGKGQRLLGIPSVLLPYLIHPMDEIERNNSKDSQGLNKWIPLRSLTIDQSDIKKAELTFQILGPLKTIKTPTHVTLETVEPPKNCPPKFPLIRLPILRDQKIVRTKDEALACSFGFLL